MCGERRRRAVLYMYCRNVEHNARPTLMLFCKLQSIFNCRGGCITLYEYTYSKLYYFPDKQLYCCGIIIIKEPAITYITTVENARLKLLRGLVL